MNNFASIQTITELPMGIEYIHFHGFNSSKESSHFANKYGLPVVLINPCYQPSVLLQKYLGLNKNHHTTVTREMTQAHIDRFSKYEALENQLIARVVIISEQDETIPPSENIRFFAKSGKIITCPNETHQFRDMQTLFAAVTSLP